MPMLDKWYKDAVIYQIWPRSFADGNGDGIGDLYGVYQRLDYVRALGSTAIWFSPLYRSPQADYGYDISDYRAIAPEYGDLDIFRKVLDRCHRLGMKVIMDLVINHTSDRHPWFVASRDQASPYRGYYFWRDRPNNWDSMFGGKAWDFDPAAGAYYMHLFTRQQPDLNMDNPKVRAEIEGIMRFWLDMGVDGFREDVINCISKTESLPDDWRPAARGMRYYVNGPHLREYLAQFKKVRDQYDAFAVGEGVLLKPKAALAMIAEGPGQLLDMMFTFQHMEADCLFTEYYPHPFSLIKLKKAFSDWQRLLAGRAWNALYIENHDHPRVISRYGSEEYRVVSGKMLAACYLFLQGTPFIYQGQEIGMTNIRLDSIDEYPDTAAHNHYRSYRRLMPERTAMRLVQRASRDSARTPMQWDATANAGFSTVKPWFAVNPDYKAVNAAGAAADPDSLLNFYRKAIALRTELPVVKHGEYREFGHLNPWIYAYGRVLDGQRLLVVCSFTARRCFFRAPKGYKLDAGRMLLGNYADAPLTADGFACRPYETRVYLFE